MMICWKIAEFLKKTVDLIIVDGADGWFYLRYLAMIPFRETGNDYVYALKSGDAR